MTRQRLLSASKLGKVDHAETSVQLWIRQSGSSSTITIVDPAKWNQLWGNSSISLTLKLWIVLWGNELNPLTLRVGVGIEGKRP